MFCWLGKILKIFKRLGFEKFTYQASTSETTVWDAPARDSDSEIDRNPHKM